MTQSAGPSKKLHARNPGYTGILQRVVHSDSHHRLLIALAAALATFAALGGQASLMAHIFITWDCFSLCLLVLIWVRMIGARPQNVRRSAKLQDSSRTAIFVFVVISACASLLALGVLLATAKDLPKAKITEHVMLSIITVLCSWILVHTVFALRYAHSFYGVGKKTPTAANEGLQFPGTNEPDYMDFAYFAFVIGMTCQVSDVQITSRSIRRLALAHGIVSFAFNTVILALTINIISGLL